MAAGDPTAAGSSTAPGGGPVGSAAGASHTSLAPRTYEALPSRVIFGVGAVASVSEEVDRFGSSRALLIDGLFDAELRRRVEADLGGRHAGSIDEVAQHVPAEVVGRALAQARAVNADALVALGGGSATGLAKAIALETGVPILAIPTTYAGSEMTPIWGITAAGRKTTGSDPRVLPRTVVYDPELVLSLPARPGAASGMNAMAHCVEALWTPAANPVTDAVASDGMARLARGLRAAHADPGDLEARAESLRGAWLAGTALAVGGTGLHHKLCHVLGGSFGLPHAEVHAAVLPWVVDYYREAAPTAQARIAAALGADDAVTGLQDLARDLGLGGGLAGLGLLEAALGEAADQAAEVAPQTPAPIDRAGIRELLGNAYINGTGEGNG
jgi:alcohol dehydrogenase class IV